MNRYLDILARNATPITRITCFGLLLLIAMSGMSSARACEKVPSVGARQSVPGGVEFGDEKSVTDRFGQKPTRPRRRSG